MADVSAFRAALPAGATGFAGVPDDALAAALDALAAAARADWPTVALDDASFAAHLGRLTPEGGDLAELSRRRGGDLYLACACARGDAAAIAAFEAAHFDEIDRAAGRTRASADLAAEARQRIRRILFVGEPGRPAACGEFAGRGSLRGWLKVIATRELIALIGKDRRDVKVGEDRLFDALAATPDPELGYLREMYRDACTSALREALDAMPERDRDLLRYAVIDGLTVDELGAIYGVHRATAARWVAKVRDGIHERTRAGLTARLGVAPDELDSILRLVVSRVDVSLERVLAPKG